MSKSAQRIAQILSMASVLSQGYPDPHKKGFPSMEMPKTKSEIEHDRKYNKVKHWCTTYKRTLQEEYELIKQKKSGLSKSLRDFVINHFEN